jgi:SAM-dependent methyltransferase
MDYKINEWDASYRNRDNFVFFPHEEVIRFTSKYIRKRIGFDEYVDAQNWPSTPRVLDLGCGIGRHVKFLHSYGLDVWGIDLSSVAIDNARNLFAQDGLQLLNEKLVQGSITSMPFEDNFFDFIVSHGVLDSMPFNLAQEAMEETARCLKPGGMFYLDLISGDDSRHYPGFCGEEIVKTSHEQGTVQSYFNGDKIRALTVGKFDVEEGFLIRRALMDREDFDSRYHLVLKNKEA